MEIEEIIKIAVQSTVFGFFLGALTRFIWWGAHKVMYMLGDVTGS